MPFTPADAVGIVGLALLLTGFTANALGRMSHASPVYQLLNALGSGLLAFYAYAIRAWVFLPLEIVWAAVAGYAYVKGRFKAA